MDFRCCAVVPTYDNPMTLRRVVETIRIHLPDVIVVDDGSARDGREVCESLSRDQLAVVIHGEKNRGKGAAVKLGLAEASRMGFTHAFQVDADGQHDLAAMPEFLRAAQDAPNHAVIGAPLYDESAPAVRLFARKITKFWVDLEAGRNVIHDAMVGFRVYPVAATLAQRAKSNRMSFDVEIAVLLARAGVPIVNLPVAIRYPSAEDGGRSHFRPFVDNLQLSWLHTRLCTVNSIRWCLRLGARAVHMGPS